MGLNRPAKRNAFNVAMIEQLAAAHHGLETDDETKAAPLGVKITPASAHRARLDGDAAAVSQYNNAAVTGPSNYIGLLVARASMTGFVVFDYADRYPEAVAEMSRWLSDGRLRSIEDT